jgi:hypothetical protein
MKVNLICKRIVYYSQTLGLSADTLQGHRQRLTNQFRRLKRFYSQSSTLQYFKNLIKVPNLPDV